MMEIKEAIANIDNVISNANLNRQQHQILLESIQLVIGRCKTADQLEDKDKQNVEQPKTDV
jgi:hypothetical protein